MTSCQVRISRTPAGSRQKTLVFFFPLFSVCTWIADLSPRLQTRAVEHWWREVLLFVFPIYTYISFFLCVGITRTALIQHLMSGMTWVGALCWAGPDRHVYSSTLEAGCKRWRVILSFFRLSWLSYFRLILIERNGALPCPGAQVDPGTRAAKGQGSCGGSDIRPLIQGHPSPVGGQPEGLGSCP